MTSFLSGVAVFTVMTGPFGAAVGGAGLGDGGAEGDGDAGGGAGDDGDGGAGLGDGFAGAAGFEPSLRAGIGGAFRGSGAFSSSCFPQAANARSSVAAHESPIRMAPLYVRGESTSIRVGWRVTELARTIPVRVLRQVCARLVEEHAIEHESIRSSGRCERARA